jgi:hypothetical protein
LTSLQRSRDCTTRSERARTTQTTARVRPTPRASSTATEPSRFPNGNSTRFARRSSTTHPARATTSRSGCAGTLAGWRSTSASGAHTDRPPRRARRNLGDGVGLGRFPPSRGPPLFSSYVLAGGAPDTRGAFPSRAAGP